MKENGYMTIYLALTLGVMISLCLALIEGCRYRGICLETECVMDIGMDSILAEYHRELFAQYNLFAVDCSYGTEHGTTKLTEEHLLEYMNHNFSLEDIFLDKFLYRDFFALEAEKAEMTKAAFVTDGDGEVFRRMAVDAIEDDVGIGLLQQIKEWVNRECTHIRLSVRVVEATEALREYRPCEKCTDKIPHPTGGLLFFVSENGECYHSRRDCPGLKRTVQKIPKEEAFKYEVCSRCRGNNSKDR